MKSMNNPFEKQPTQEQINASHIDYGNKGITIVCGANCACKEPHSETSNVKPTLWVKLLKRFATPLSRTKINRLKD